MTHLDTLLFLWINATPGTPAWLLALARWVSTDLPALAVVGLAPLLLFGPAARRQCLGVGLAMVLAWLAVRGIRETVHVARPFELGLGAQWIEHAATASFPSFHAAVAGAWALALALLAPSHPRRWLAVAGGVALAIAWSRVFLGLHFVSDVAVGLLLGGACAVTARQGLAWWARRRAVWPIRPVAGSGNR
ncbi:MAG: phosphatase PAP2 family protein [Hydrogenophaga sp.]|uniref:phosphatase PAP2 family protein n=1 Tax=Hydrogenophaga sp. TaxID=1904254 RepID=UPI0026280AAD|nr:phosphatase PAP2 family protein [Hydrogenophaga sp.]MCW5671668.1 phosphatase PAP2 family protein [Hydrogenophaga sp.]